MSTKYTTTPEGLFRDSENAVFGGVCAGISNYLGLPLGFVRIIFFIAIFAFAPLAITGYFILMFTLPKRMPNKRKGPHISHVNPLGEVSKRMRKLEGRLAKLESYLISESYELNKNIKKL